MPEATQEVYQDNGFELVIYHQRKPDPFKTCPQCGKKLWPVASLYDEWQESYSSNSEYWFCRHCQHILQESLRLGPNERLTNLHYHTTPPYEMVLQLLAHARHINGRGITRLTINRRWWQAWRYPLVMGDQLPQRIPRVRPGNIGNPQEAWRLQDEQVLHTAPLPRYQSGTSTSHRNPFTSRQVKSDEATSPSKIDEAMQQIENLEAITPDTPDDENTPAP